MLILGFGMSAMTVIHGTGVLVCFVMILLVYMKMHVLPVECLGQPGVYSDGGCLHGIKPPDLFGHLFYIISVSHAFVKENTKTIL